MDINYGWYSESVGNSTTYTLEDGTPVKVTFVYHDYEEGKKYEEYHNDAVYVGKLVGSVIDLEEPLVP